MKSSIYISTGKLELVAYEKSGKRVTVSGYFTTPLPEGVIINGKITEPGPLIQALSDMSAKYPKLFVKPNLVVDGAFLYSKKINVPKLRRQQYLSLIKEEFEEVVEDVDMLVCDYHMFPTGKDGKLSLLACATERETLDSYIAVFGEAGIVLGSIRVGMQSVLYSVEHNPIAKSGTFVLNIVDGISMLSMIFDEGTNTFISRTRLYYDNQESLARVLEENLSGLMQFTRSQQSDEITSSYYMGLDKVGLSFVQESNSSGIELLPYELPQVMVNADMPQDVHFALLAAALPDSCINLLKSYEELKKVKKKVKKPKDMRLILAGGLAALVLIPSAALFVLNMQMDRKINEVNDYLTNPAITDKIKELDELSKEMSYFGKIKQQTDLLDVQYSLMIPVTTEILDFINQTHSNKVTVRGIDFIEQDGTIKVTASSATESDSAAYVEALRVHPKIVNIRYTGYSYGAGEGDRNFNFTLEINLFAEEAKTND